MHEEHFPKMPCGHGKLNASCKRTHHTNMSYLWMFDCRGEEPCVPAFPQDGGTWQGHSKKVKDLPQKHYERSPSFQISIFPYQDYQASLFDCLIFAWTIVLQLFCSKWARASSEYLPDGRNQKGRVVS